MLSSDECKNSTGVGGVELENAGASGSSSPSGTKSGSAASATASGAADNMRAKAGAVVGALAVGVGALIL